MNNCVQGVVSNTGNTSVYASTLKIWGPKICIFHYFQVIDTYNGWLVFDFPVASVLSPAPYLLQVFCLRLVSVLVLLLPLLLLFSSHLSFFSSHPSLHHQHLAIICHDNKDPISILANKPSLVFLILTSTS